MVSDPFEFSFSVAEKEEYLKRLGYTINRRIVEKEEHLHGSRFVPFLSVEVTAIKGDIKENIHQAFAREFKKKLLEL